MARPLPGEYNEQFQQKYIDAAKGNDIEELIKNHSIGFIDFVNGIPGQKADFAYAENKWNVKELLQHIIDTERIFIYRLLRLARRDAYAMPGFEQDIFATNSHASQRSLDSLKKEFSLLRQSTDIFLLSLTGEDLSQKGIVSNYTITVNSLSFIIFGHVQHHINILKERYFID